MLKKGMIQKATAVTDWHLANKILYDLCKKYPRHGNYPEILAKIWIIGRSYAAAIERRKKKNVNIDVDFYIDEVAPTIYDSDIDLWFDELRRFRSINTNSTPEILEVHYKVTDLFSNISGLEKRSLASKYLHFHFPNLYFIYDSRVLTSISKLNKHIDRVGKNKYTADNEYRKLFEKCINLQEVVNNKYNIKMRPRQIDNLLLNIAENT